MKSYTVYIAALLRKFPEQASELLAYQLTIVKAAQQYDGLQWRAYDATFGWPLQRLEIENGQRWTLTCTLGFSRVERRRWHVAKRGRENKWRLIVDLSFAEGHSVNDGIDPLSYVTVDDIAARVCALGRGSLGAKCDIRCQSTPRAASSSGCSGRNSFTWIRGRFALGAAALLCSRRCSRVGGEGVQVRACLPLYRRSSSARPAALSSKGACSTSSKCAKT